MIPPSIHRLMEKMFFRMKESQKLIFKNNVNDLDLVYMSIGIYVQFIVDFLWWR